MSVAISRDSSRVFSSSSRLARFAHSPVLAVRNPVAKMLAKIKRRGKPPKPLKFQQLERFCPNAVLKDFVQRNAAYNVDEGVAFPRV